EGASSAAEIFGEITSNCSEDTGLVLDYSRYYSVDTKDIPHGYVEVNVLIDDNGTEIPAKMTAGHVGMQVSTTYDTDDEIKQRNTVKPSSGWWIFTTLPEGQVRNNDPHGRPMRRKKKIATHDHEHRKIPRNSSK
ncbi:hypothetical protein BGZ46_006056, partial [Entomortierella lignicola]